MAAELAFPVMDASNVAWMVSPAEGRAVLGDSVAPWLLTPELDVPPPGVSGDVCSWERTLSCRPTPVGKPVGVPSAAAPVGAPANATLPASMKVVIKTVEFRQERHNDDIVGISS
jgi:hypothetical protein